jgi:WD40 repeat protein
MSSSRLHGCRFLPVFCLLFVSQALGADTKKHATDSYGDPLPAGAIARLGSLRFLHDGTIGPVAISPDGKIIAAGQIYSRSRYEGRGHSSGWSGQVRLWNTETGREIGRLGATWQICSVAFSPDGALLATGGSHHVHVWQTQTRQKVCSFEPPQKLSSVTFSRDGKRLIALQKPGQATVWEIIAMGPGLRVRKEELATCPEKRERWKDANLH